jgi:hypothetical protein
MLEVRLGSLVTNRLQALRRRDPGGLSHGDHHDRHGILLEDVDADGGMLNTSKRAPNQPSDALVVQSSVEELLIRRLQPPEMELEPAGSAAPGLHCCEMTMGQGGLPQHFGAHALSFDFNVQELSSGVCRNAAARVL